MDEIDKVLKERGETYGDAHEQFEMWESMCLIWSEYYRCNRTRSLDPDFDNSISKRRSWLAKEKRGEDVILDKTSRFVGRGELFGFDAFSGLMRMAILKLVRIAVNPEHKDSWLDLYGYLRLAEKEIFDDEQK